MCFHLFSEILTWNIIHFVHDVWLRTEDLFVYFSPCITRKLL